MNRFQEIRENYMRDAISGVLKRYEFRNDGKKSTELATSLPYGLCEDIGVETEGMTPREAWSAYEKETGSDAGEVIKEKLKHPGKEIDVSDFDKEIEDARSKFEGIAKDSMFKSDFKKAYEVFKNEDPKDYEGMKVQKVVYAANELKKVEERTGKNPFGKNKNSGATEMVKPDMDLNVPTLKNWRNAEDDYLKNNTGKDGLLWGTYDREDQRIMQENLQKVFDHAELMSNVNSEHLGEILTGEFKNQFQTHTSDGSLDLNDRAAAAYSLFGMPMNEALGGENREKYGYVCDEEDYEHSLGESGPDYGNSGSGSKMAIVFRKEKIANRTTWTQEDSLEAADDPDRRDYAAGAFDTVCSISGLSYGESTNYFGNKSVSEAILKGDLARVSQMSDLYVEAQFHGKVTADDIGELRFSNREECMSAIKNLDDGALNVINSKGILVRFYDGDEWVNYKDSDDEY